MQKINRDILACEAHVTQMQHHIIMMIIIIMITIVIVIIIITKLMDLQWHFQKMALYPLFPGQIRI